MDLCSENVGRMSRSESVTLLKFCNSNNNGGYKNKYHHHSATLGSNSRAIPPIVAKKSEKFFRTLRKRSKSATRLNRSSTSPDFRGSDGSLNNNYCLDQPSQNPSPERISTQPHRHSVFSETFLGPPDRVTLVGYSSQSELSRLDDCSSFTSLRRRPGGDFGGSVYHLNEKRQNHFSTLKTSREVKMERERLRQERLGRLGHPEAQAFFDRVRREDDETRARFFEEARQKFHERRTSGPFAPHPEFFSPFFRENQERFAQLVKEQQRRMTTTICSSTAQSSSRGSSCQSSLSQTRSSTLSSGAFSNISRSNEEQKADPAQSSPELPRGDDSGDRSRRVTRHIPIARVDSPIHLSEERPVVLSVDRDSGQEDSCQSSLSSSSPPPDSGLNRRQCHKQNSESKDQVNSKATESSTSTTSESVQRTLSTASRLSSSSSSGFSSIEGGEKKIESNSNQNTSSFHHPTFTNHFGFFARSKNAMNESNSCSKLPTFGGQYSTFERSLSSNGSSVSNNKTNGTTSGRGVGAKIAHGKLSVIKSKSVSIEENGRDLR